MTLPDLIRSSRERAALSQRELGDATGIDKSTLSRLENGRRTPTFPHVRALVRELGLDANEVLK
jgi:transcriptional regulator with XRE-family HTH domain